MRPSSLEDATFAPRGLHRFGTITVVESELDVERLPVLLLGLSEPALVLDDEAVRVDADAGASRGLDRFG